jgi:hypothetical protein
MGIYIGKLCHLIKSPVKLGQNAGRLGYMETIGALVLKEIVIGRID